MEPIEGSETSAFINQTPGNYPKGNLLYTNPFVYWELILLGEKTKFVVTFPTDSNLKYVSNKRTCC